MTTDEIMALANKYAASNGKALLEKLYGTSQSYTEQCTAEAFQDRQALRAAIETLRHQKLQAITDQADQMTADEALMRQALEALVGCEYVHGAYSNAEAAIIALKERLK